MQCRFRQDGASVRSMVIICYDFWIKHMYRKSPRIRAPCHPYQQSQHAAPHHPYQQSQRATISETVLRNAGVHLRSLTGNSAFGHDAFSKGVQGLLEVSQVNLWFEYSLRMKTDAEGPSPRPYKSIEKVNRPRDCDVVKSFRYERFRQMCKNVHDTNLKNLLDHFAHLHKSECFGWFWLTVDG